jgi:pimeloyl-ACP methyl ester carboxylesterase
MFTASTAAADPHPLVGNWLGYWARAGDTLAVEMHAQRDSSGQYKAAFDSDRLRVSGIPFSQVEVRGCCVVKMTLIGDRTTAVFTGNIRGDTLSGPFREGEDEGRFVYSRVATVARPFEEREITFANGPTKLAGSLILPRTGNSLTAVVFLHGSGAEGRWASRFLATQVARQGIAALIFDKRGVGASTGDWKNATPEDLAGDDVAAVARLLQEPRINGKRIGIHGHSQGGTLAPLVAARSKNVAFVIGSAAAGIPMDSVEIYSVLNSVYPKATTAADSADARAYVRELVAVAYHGGSRQKLDSIIAASKDRPWFFEPPAPGNSYWSFSRVLARYQPLQWWAKVRVPVLLVYGADDKRVPPAESADRISNTLRRAGNHDVTVRIFPGADHTFRLPPGPSGWPDTAPGYISTLVDWLSRRR